jgi:GTP-binding protein
MLPVIAIVGRPNVGKSTLFNRLTRRRDALVADRAGITRDRQYGIAEYRGRRLMLVDTGGLGDFESDLPALAERVAGQSQQAIREADAVIWLVDGRGGLTAADASLGEELRPFSDKLFLAVNKCEGLDPDLCCADFHTLGLGPRAISAEHGDGVAALMDAVLGSLPAAAAPAEEPEGLSIAVIGRPNVGKSTLINRMLGEERMLTFDQPGTTRDAVAVPFERRDKHYVLIDTAGVRRRARIADQVEKISVIKTLKAIEQARIVIAVIDAREALTEQDLGLLGLTAQSGKPLVIAVNKWDGLDEAQRARIRGQLERRLGFVDYACIRTLSALHGTGVGGLFDTLDRIGRTLDVEINPSRLTEILAEAVRQHAPPLIRGRRIKLRYAHLGGHDPLRVIIHGNQTRHVPENYRRYLAGVFRKQLNLVGTPVQVEFKYGENPYRHKKNVLTPRQERKRRRVIRHRKDR